MGLAQIQAAQARLYTNAADRAAFYDKPQSFKIPWGLDDGDIDRLLAIPRSQIEAFAVSLIAKRRGEVAKMLPLTRKALGGHFADIFRQYAERFTPAGIHRHRDDALAFARSLHSRCGHADIPLWVRDIARYEAARIAAVHSRRPQLLLIHSDIRKFVFSSETACSDLPRSITLLLIWPIKGSIRVLVCCI